MSSRRVFARAAALILATTSALGTALAGAGAASADYPVMEACADLDRIPSATMTGSYVPTKIEASAELPAPVDTGRYRVLWFSAGCESKSSLDGDFTGLRIGDLMIGGGSAKKLEVLESTGEFVFTGSGWMQHKAAYWSEKGGEVSVNYELTLRDVNDLGPASGGIRADSFTLRLFDKTDPTKQLLVVEGQMWGTKIVRIFKRCDLVWTCIPIRSPKAS